MYRKYIGCRLHYSICCRLTSYLCTDMHMVQVCVRYTIHVVCCTLNGIRCRLISEAHARSLVSVAGSPVHVCCRRRVFAADSTSICCRLTNICCRRRLSIIVDPTSIRICCRRTSLPDADPTSICCRRTGTCLLRAGAEYLLQMCGRPTPYM